jgi:hypothetical protein
MRKIIIMLTVLVFGGLAATGCGGGEQSKPHPPSQAEIYKQVAKKASRRAPYLPKNDVEFKNYNHAQEIYDDPSNILWCTFSFNNPSSPLVTVPVTGKLTSSSTSYFAPEGVLDDHPGSYSDASVIPKRSVDGLYHPNPPQYRYGFTPGGAYVDFFNLETYCSNKPTQFQRKSTKISLTVDANLGRADTAAQAALKAGKPALAQRIIENAIGDQK